MRLIDADALEVFVKTVRQGLHLDKTLSDILTRDSMLLNFQQYVHFQPTIDAVPVVRGYSYEDDKTYSGPGTSNYICSVCGEMQGTWKKGLAQNQKFKFCPWCGAKMEDKPCR